VAEVTITLPELYPAQRAVIDDPARFKVLRCGRRWGKNVAGYVYIAEAILERKPLAWFAPTYKILADAWREILTMLRPLCKHVNAQEHRIEFHGGATLEFWSLDGPDPARGRKYWKVVVDEAGVVADLETRWSAAIRPTLTDYRGQALILGTPKVNGPFFNVLFNFGTNGEPGWKSFRGRTSDNPYIDHEEIEEARRTMPPWMFAQEYEGEPADSDTAFFVTQIIENHVSMHGRDCDWQGHIDAANGTDADTVLGRGLVDSIRFKREPGRGPWKLWLLDFPKGRPTQDRPYVIGVDIAAGVGSSNTVMSAWDAESRVKVGQYTYPGVTPDVAARLAALAGFWFGGTLGKGFGGLGPGCAIINFESNGPGQLFGRELAKLGYPMVYRDRASPLELAQPHVTRMGWNSTASAKEYLLGEYRAAMARGELVNPCVEALRECLTYSVDRLGRVVSESDKPSADGLARAPHGDMVIADALGYRTCSEARRITTEAPALVPHSPAWRMKRAKEEDRQVW